MPPIPKADSLSLHSPPSSLVRFAHFGCVIDSSIFQESNILSLYRLFISWMKLCDSDSIHVDSARHFFHLCDYLYRLTY
ncbi:hypothetical protein AB3S75_010965 [Citrus x aurantiifolia]